MHMHHGLNRSWTTSLTKRDSLPMFRLTMEGELVVLAMLLLAVARFHIR
jgi:hypothetical protein